MCKAYLENLTLLKKFDSLADLIQLVPECFAAALVPLLLPCPLPPPNSGRFGKVLIDLRLLFAADGSAEEELGSWLLRVRLVRLTMWACLVEPAVKERNMMSRVLIRNSGAT